MRTTLFFLILLLFFGCSRNKQQMRIKSDKVVIGYVFPGDRIINPDEIAAEKLTHINYAFANLSGNKMVEGFLSDSINFTVLNSLKQRNPDLKILISVGGWTWSGGFSDMSLTPESRNEFVQSAVDFVLKYQLDGLDIDWEYPGLPGMGNTYRAEDKENFTLLLQECRKALDKVQKGDTRYLLTIAAGAFADFISATDMLAASEYLDMVNLMTYDFTGEWNQTTGHHANLYTPKLNPEANSTQKAVDLFNEAGVPKEKIVVGAAFYGRGWSGAESADNGLFKPATGLVNASLGYSNIKETYLSDADYIQGWDQSAKAPYLFNPNDGTFITYENPQSVYEKCKFIKDRGLKGIMFWQYFSDHQTELLTVMEEALLY